VNGSTDSAQALRDYAHVRTVIPFIPAFFGRPLIVVDLRPL
jgi:hypothetical protein